jgi:hypothetical protein
MINLIHWLRAGFANIFRKNSAIMLVQTKNNTVIAVNIADAGKDRRLL